MGGDGHHGAVAVVGQHVVRGPHRKALAVGGVDGVALEEDAGLRPIGGLTLDLGLTTDRLDVVAEALPHVGRGSGSQLSRQLALRCDDEEGRPVEGVRARREDGDLLRVPFDLEIDVGSDRSPDPVPLHADDLLRPSPFELIQVVEESIGVVGDLEVPLFELLLDHHRTAALGCAVGKHLLVGEHGLIHRVPVDGGVLAVCEPPLVKTLEQPLVPLVVIRVARVEDAVPVERDPVGTESGLLLCDVVVRPLPRVRAALDRGVLGGQAE